MNIKKNVKCFIPEKIKEMLILDFTPVVCRQPTGDISHVIELPNFPENRG